MDPNLALAFEQVHATGAGTGAEVAVRSFFDKPTNTVGYVIHDPVSRRGAVIDSVLDFDAAAGGRRPPPPTPWSPMRNANG